MMLVSIELFHKNVYILEDTINATLFNVEKNIKGILIYELPT